MAARRVTALLGAMAGALVLALCAINMGGAKETELAYSYPEQQMNMAAQTQMLPEYEVSGSMETGEPAPQGIPLSFQLPVPLPEPSPPAPSVITVGPRPKKAPVCKECEHQMKKIKVSPLHPSPHAAPATSSGEASQCARTQALYDCHYKGPEHPNKRGREGRKGEPEGGGGGQFFWGEG